MLSQDKMNRINALAKKSKTEGLTDAEKKEQKALRDEYLKVFRKGFRQRLENLEVTYVEDLEKKS